MEGWDGPKWITNALTISSTQKLDGSGISHSLARDSANTPASTHVDPSRVEVDPRKSEPGAPSTRPFGNSVDRTNLRAYTTASHTPGCGSHKITPLPTGIVAWFVD